MPTKTLSTDRHGNVYRGPRTYREAESLIDSEDADPFDVARRMDDAGFTLIANRIRRDYGERSKIAGITIQHDPSGQGHAWRLVDLTANTMRDTAEEIAAEIRNGKRSTCPKFIDGGGRHFRW